MAVTHQQRADALAAHVVHPDRGASARLTAFVLAGVLFAGAAIVTAIVVLDAGTVGAGAPHQAAVASAQRSAAAVAVTAARIAVTLKEFTLTPRPATARAGTVTFRVRNAGAVRHEFVVLRTRRPAARLLKGSEASEAGNVGEIGDLRPGVTKSLRLRLAAGHYALICNLPGHYRAGQRADLTVR
jgi:uncharacterized cupredoxin-like copper-binding protein